MNWCLFGVLGHGVGHGVNQYPKRPPGSISEVKPSVDLVHRRTKRMEYPQEHVWQRLGGGVAAWILKALNVKASFSFFPCREPPQVPET